MNDFDTQNITAPLLLLATASFGNPEGVDNDSTYSSYQQH